MRAGLLAAGAGQVEFKTGPDNMVTQADRDAERLIVEAIRRRHPGHGLIGEEGSRAAGDEFRWIIDPIDGTTNLSSSSTFRLTGLHPLRTV